MAHRLTLLLGLPLLVILALACGGGEEEATPTQSPTPAASPAASPSPGGTPSACPSPTGTAPEPVAKTYPAAPETSIDPAKKYTAVVKTVRGDFTIDLLPDLAPQHVNSFVFLARDHFFDGIIFHRVEPGFVVQGGDPTGTGRGGPGYSIPLEPSAEPFVRGVLGMARSEAPDSAGSQWFVTLGDALFLNDLNMPLDKRYTVFGKATQGMEVVDCIAVGDAIISIEILEE